MRMTLQITEKETHMVIVADSDFEKNMLKHVKESFPKILAAIETEEREYGGYSRTPTGAEVVLTFLKEPHAEA